MGVANTSDSSVGQGDVFSCEVNEVGAADEGAPRPDGCGDAEGRSLAETRLKRTHDGDVAINADRKEREDRRRDAQYRYKLTEFAVEMSEGPVGVQHVREVEGDVKC